MTEMEKARELAELEDQIKVAVRAINAASVALYGLGMDVKLGGFDWHRPGHSASLSVNNGALSANVLSVDKRPRT